LEHGELPVACLEREFAEELGAKLSRIGSSIAGCIGGVTTRKCDARLYLSDLTVDSKPAGTVTTNRKLTNAPLVVRSVDDALLAAIELHDLPAPDDPNTPKTPGAGCPVPPVVTNVSYGPSPKDVICPPYGSATSQTDRSDSREVIRRFRALSPDDEQAVIEFLKQL
jgi:hypothetical protein